jgi:poly-gamma-glutamate synthesis protein (capsule biosynthesis protein)
MIALLACAPGEESATEVVFPYAYTPRTDLEPFEEVRWETETWDPYVDTDQAALYLQKAVLHRKSAPVEELAHFEAMRAAIPPLAAGTQLDFVGDVMWVGGNWDAFLAPAADLLAGDLRIGNLETPTDPDQPTDKSDLDLYAFNAPPEILDGLPLDVLQLNNNHTLDMGDEGIDATLIEVDRRAFAHSGVDGHAGVGDVAFLSFTWGLNVRDVTPTHELFVVPFGHLDEEVDLTPIADAIALAQAAGWRHTVVLAHWGYEYEYYPDPHFMVLAREIIALGADVVVGAGPHVVQPPEICSVNSGTATTGTCAVTTEDGLERTAAVLYSLGNFGTVMQTAPCRVGIVGSVTLGDGGVTGLGWRAAASVTVADGVEVRPLEEVLDDEDFAAEDARLEAHLGAGWRIP